MIGVFDNIGAAMIAAGVAGAGVIAMQTPVGKMYFMERAETMVRAAGFAAMYGYVRGVDYGSGVEEVKASAARLAKQVGFSGDGYGAREAADMMARARDYATHYGFPKVK